MNRRKRLLLGGGACLLSALVALAASSSHYECDSTAVTKACGYVESGARTVQASLGDTAVGVAQSAGYEIRAGFLPAQGFDDRWVWSRGLPDPGVIGATGSANLPWTSSRAASYQVRLGATVLASGSVSADEAVTSSVLAADLPADDAAEIVVTADDGSETSGVAFRVLTDTTAPVTTTSTSRS